MTEPELALPRPPGALRQLWRRHPRWVDALLAAAYLLYGVFGTFSVDLATGVGRPTAVVVALLATTAVAAAALLVRRRAPWLTFAVVGVATVVLFVVDGGLDPIGVALALYALAVHRSNGSAWIGFAASAVGCVVLALATARYPGSGSSAIGPVFLGVTLVATLVGANAGNRGRYVRALVDRAEQLGRERDQQAQLATAAERARITREMHDVVAHSISIMVSLSDGADALAQEDPARSRDAIRETSAIGRRSLTEMRRLLGAHGSEEPAASGGAAPLRPQPGSADLTELVATFRSAGLPVEVEVQGVPPPSAGLQTVTYRVVQESLTNALRYATSPHRVLVEIDYRGGGVEVTVTDDGQQAQTPQPSVGSGCGLIGIRERALLYGGTMTAGPHPGAGWRVHVSVPRPTDEE